MPKSLLRFEDSNATQPTATVVSLNERKQTLVRDTIWEAAIDLFAEKGFDETTVEDIAAAAGTSRRSFFRYFESKSDLMAQPIVSYGTSLTDSLRGGPVTYRPAEVLRYTLLTVAKASAANPRTKKVMEIAAKYPAARQAQIARLAEVQDQVAAAFTERFKKGSKDQTTARVLAALTHSLLSVTFQNWSDSGQGDIAISLKHVLTRLCDVACISAESAHSKRRR
ncbi:MAG: TetR family transcriptional regulator [Bryobacteraceae bacterium]